MYQWEQMTYQDCLLVPDLVTNLIGTKLVTRTQGKVTFKNELVTVQDKYSHTICVPTSGDGYPATAMIIWDDSMPEPAVSLVFAVTTASTVCPPESYNKADLWHQRLGNASHESIMHTRVVTHAHDIPANPTTHSGVLCDVCVRSKAIAHNVAHPRHVGKPLELVSMDVMGPLHGNAKFAYVLIIHDTFSGMIWVCGLANKGGVSQEVAWWLLEVHVATHQWPSHVVLDHGLKEVRMDQGELWSTAFRDTCLSTGVKITASPTQQHTDNAFAEQAIQTVQKIACSLLYNSDMDKCWWPHAISQAVFIHNQLMDTTRGHITPFELFYGKQPDLCNVQHFGCITYVMLRGSTQSTWLRSHPIVSKHLCPCALRGIYLSFSDTLCAIKGHKVWLPKLNRIVAAKDIQFSKLERPGTAASPPHMPVIAGNS
ncbi:hypothetical protein NDA13_003402 [Ustilago tritici]|nr:hypothetical protein NDA13_003402 [Ustilago tritici]